MSARIHILVLIASVFSSRIACSQEIISERAVLDANTSVVKMLSTVGDFVNEKQWPDAIQILEKVAAEHGETLVAVRPRRFVEAATYCQLVAAGLPPEGLAVYRRRVDPQARQWFEAGKRNRDAAMLERVVRRAFASSYGDDALSLLGEWAWDAGDAATARNHWERILPLKFWETVTAVDDKPKNGQPLPILCYPDSDLDLAAVLARRVMCSIVQGDTIRARLERDRLRKEFPEATGSLAGREGKWIDLVDGLLKDAAGWQAVPGNRDVLTFAGDATRNRAFDDPVRVGVQRWTPIPLPKRPAYTWDTLAGGFGEPAFLSFFPTVTGDTLIVNDDERVFAFDLHTGKSKYTETAVKSIEELERDASIHRVETVDPKYDVIGIPRFTSTISDGRIYARMGSPVTSKARSETVLRSKIVCLSLAREGGHEWSLAASDLGGEQGEWMFEGSPAVVEGRVYAVLRRSHPQTQLKVVCVDADTPRRGQPPQVIWQRPVCAAVNKVSERHNLISHQLLSVAEDNVFFSTGLGAIAAIDKHTGRVNWIVTYPSHLPADNRELNDLQRNGLTPCVFHRGLIVAAPQDSDRIFAIHARTGIVLWQRPIPDKRESIRHILGVTDDRVVVSGKRLWGLDRGTGAVRYRFPAENAEPQGYGFGRGLISGSEIWWPTRGLIHRRDIRSGAAAGQPINLRAKGGIGGNLMIAGGMLFVAEPRRLAAYSQAGGATPPTAVPLSQRTARLWYELAVKQETAGDTTVALNSYAESLKLAKPGDEYGGRPLRQQIAARRYELLMRIAMDTGDAWKSAMRFEAAAQAAPTRLQEYKAKEQQAAAFVAAGQPKESIAVWQNVLDDDELSQLALKSPQTPTAASAAGRHIDELLRKHGRGIYEEIERKAARTFAELKRAGDAAALYRAALRYRNAEGAAELRLEYAGDAVDAGGFHDAVQAWQRLLRAPARSAVRRDSLPKLARAFEKHGYWQAAAKTWRTFAREFPQTLVDGMDRTASEFVSHHLAELRSHLAPLREPRPPIPAWRIWSREFSKEADTVVPVGTPPSVAMQVLLANDEGVQAIELITGKARWSRRFETDVEWAAYGDACLLLSTRRELAAVTYETGQVVWRRPWAAGSRNDVDRRSYRWLADGNRLIVRMRDRVFCVDCLGGDPLWESPFDGDISKTWFADERHIILHHRSKMLCLDATTGGLLSEQPTTTAVWRAAPLRLDATRFAVVDGDRRIRSWLLPGSSPSERNWVYDGPISYAHTHPVLFPGGRNLGVVLNGKTMASLSPATGKLLWQRGLSGPPMAAPRDHVASQGRHIYSVESGRIVCRSSDDGSVNWETTLPDARAGWHCAALGECLVAHSVGPHSVAVVADSRTGNLIQQLPLPAATTSVTSAYQFLIVTQPRRVSVLGTGSPLGRGKPDESLQ